MTTDTTANANSYPLVPGLAGVPCAESAISFIDGERGILEYRGIPIQELAAHSTFEETAHLLLYGKLPAAAELAAFTADLACHREVPAEIVALLRALPPGGHPMSALQAGVAALGMLHPVRNVQDPFVQRMAVMRLIAVLPGIAAVFHRLRRGESPLPPRADLSHAAHFLYQLQGTVPDPDVARTMDVAFILHADHTMNASTFAARVVGSTLADPHSVVAAAIGALNGPLHGGANERVLAFLRGIGSLGNVAPTIDAALARKEKIVGLGHRIYHIKDPRAVMLQELAERLFARFGREPLYDLALEVERVAADRLGPRGIFPNVDFYSGAVYAKMGIAEDLFTPIFAAGRVAGWLAHWLELLRANRIYRPEQVYVGSRGRRWVPVAERG
jgi:citrate synthase